MAAAHEDDRLFCHVCLEGGNNDDGEEGDYVRTTGRHHHGQRGGVPLAAVPVGKPWLGDAASASGGGQLVHGGCGCRGSAGFGHLPCLVEAAMHNLDSWTMCPTCLQDYTGPAVLGLARARDELSSTMMTKHNLANALQGMCEFAEARQLYEEVVAERTAQLGPAHIDIVTTKGNLANLLAEMGERAKARRLFEEVLAGKMAQLGPVYTSTLKTKMFLANLLAKMGERAEARRLLDEVVVGQTAQLGPAHIDSLAAKCNLANLLAKMGERAEARQLYEEVVVGQTALLGPGHTDTLGTKNNLALLLMDPLMSCFTGDLAEGRRLSEEAVAGFTEHLGMEHPLTKLAEKNLALINYRQLFLGGAIFVTTAVCAVLYMRLSSGGAAMRGVCTMISNSTCNIGSGGDNGTSSSTSST